MTVTLQDLPVRRTVVVHVPVDEAFEVFTADVDAWWPRTHHIGKSEMRRIVIEERSGGRCYTEHVDGTEYDWGRVLVWEPPRRLLLAWRVTHTFGHEADLSKASEVDVRFIPVDRGATRVEVEHRFFTRHGSGAETLRAVVDAPNGWTRVMGEYETYTNTERQT